MELSYDNLILHVAMDYNSMLIFGGQLIMKHYHNDCDDYFACKKRNDAEDELDDELSAIEDDINLLLLLCNIQNKNERNNANQPPKKKGKYSKN